MRITRSRIVGAAVLSLLIVGALSACGAPTPVVTTTPVATSDPEPSPSPTIAPAAVALPRLAITCGDVLSDAEASEALGRSVQLKVDELAVRGIRDIAQRQAGAFSCVWGGEFKTDNGWDDSIVLDVLPDAAADYDLGVEQVDDGAIPYSAGVLSEYLCSPYAIWWCDANLLIDGYWAHLNVHVSEGGETAPSDAEQRARMGGLLDGLAATITSAPVNPTWALEPASDAARLCTGDAVANSAGELLAVPQLVGTPYVPNDPTDIQSVAQIRGGLSICSWGTDRRLGLSYLPGGGWAFAQLQEDLPSTNYLLPALAPVQVEGADSALTASGAGYGEVLLSMQGAAIDVGIDDPGTDFPAQAGRLAATFLAAG